MKPEKCSEELSVSELDDSFTKLLGRQPTDEERQRLYRVRDALGLKNNDALWQVLMALQYYQNQYERFPKEIAQAATDTLATLKITADAAMKAAAEAAKADLAKTVATAASEVAHDVVGIEKLQWLVTAIAVFIIFLATNLGAVWYADNMGYKSGYASAYEDTRDEKAAAAWANTPQGRLAYRLAQGGDLDNLANCNKPGWYIQKNRCIPGVVRGGVFGWNLR